MIDPATHHGLFVLLIAIGLPVAWIILFILICLLLSSISGWQKLSLRFRNGSFTVPTAYVRPWAATMGWGANYNNILRIAATPEKLCIYTPSLFIKLFHPPLAIPWHEVRIERSPRWYIFQPITFRLGSYEEVPLRVSKRVARKILASAGRKIDSTIEGLSV